MRAHSMLALVAAAYAALALAVFRPALSDLSHTLPAHAGSSADALLLTWATSHVSQTIASAPTELFDGRIFHPARQTLAFGDHMIGQALLGLPVWWATGNPLLEYNLLSLGSYVAGGTAAFAYLRAGLGLAPTAAFAGGLVFAFTSYRYHSPLWLQVLWTAFAPLALLAWLRFVHTLHPAWWGLWVACWAVHSLMGMYLTLYFAIVMGTLAVFALAAAPTRRDPLLWTGSILAPIASLALVAPTLWPYVTLRSLQGNVRTVGLGTWPSFLLPHPDTLSATLAGWDGAGRFGPGLIAWLLIAVGAAAVARALRTAPPPDEGAPEPEASAPLPTNDRFVWQTVLVGLGVVLLLVFTPIEVQHELPGLDMLRNTNRAFFIGLLFLGALAARGVAVLTSAASAGAGRAVVGGMVLAALAFDTGTPPSERVRHPVGLELSPAVEFFAALPDDSIVYEHRHGPDGLATAMYHAIFHRKRIPTGYSGFTPPGGLYASHILYRFPDAQSLDLMHRLGVDYVWVPFRQEARVEAVLARLAATPVRVAARFGADVVFDVRTPLPVPPATRRTRRVPPAAWRLEATGGAHDLPLLFDHDPGTVWRHPPPAARTPPTLVVDVGSARPLAGIVVQVPRDLPAEPYLARIAVSRDGREWTELEAGFLPEPFDELFTAPRPVLTFAARFPTRLARYVRLASPEMLLWGEPWEIGELAVLEDAGL